MYVQNCPVTWERKRMPRTWKDSIVRGRRGNGGGGVVVVRGGGLGSWGRSGRGGARLVKQEL